MMSIYLHVYLLVYCISLFMFFACLTRRLCAILINNVSFHTLIEIFELFESTLKLTLLLLLFLSGLPPFLLFFIKFNLVVSVIAKINTYLFLFLYIIIFNSTIYYLQIFSNKYKGYRVASLINSSLTFKVGFLFFNNSKNKTTAVDYYMCLRISYLYFISTFGYSFFLDFYFISLLIT